VSAHAPPAAPRRATVLGDGGWGTALALLLDSTGIEVTLWGAFPEYVDEVRRTRVNRKFLPGPRLPERLSLEADAEAACARAELIVAAVPTKFMRATFERLAGVLPRQTPYVTVAKGVEAGRLRLGSEIILEVLGPVPVGVLSGPSHAEEVSRGLPTAVVAAAADPALGRIIQAAFMAKTFRVYTSADVLGVELAGAVKNVMAIAAGICDGLEFGDNSKAALVARGLAEMTRFGVARGATPETFSGLAGVGDLVTTCYSRHGRNRAVGVRLGRGETRAQIEGSMEMVAEGVLTAPGVVALARESGIEMPIAAEVVAVLFDGKPPRQAVTDLMTRPPRSEREQYAPPGA
jgi:glycerol-3-phosphate dehydrogenase (NAD(P)+)